MSDKGSGSFDMVPIPPSRALKRRGAELDFLPAALEILERPPSPTWRWTKAAIALLVILALTLSVVSRLDIVASAPGRIILKGNTKTVQNAEPGVVKTIFVREGDHVRENQPLILLDATAAEADLTRLNRDLVQAQLDRARAKALLDHPTPFDGSIKASEAQLRTTRDQVFAARSEHAAKLANIDQQLEQRRREHATLAAMIDKVEAMLPIVEARFDMRRQLFDKQLTSRLVFLEAQQNLLEITHERLITRSRQAELGATLAALDEQRKMAEAEFARTTLAAFAEAEQKITALQQDIVKTEQRLLQMTIRAPVTGLVQQLEIHTVGGVVMAGQKLMSVVPDGTDLEVQATIPNKDIGFIQIGQEVEIKLEAYSFTRYGLIKGTVTSLSRDSMAPQTPGITPHRETASAGAAGTQNDSQYLAIIALRDRSLMTEKGLTLLTPGLTVTAEIKTGRRRVIDYILSPLGRYQQETLRER